MDYRQRRKEQAQQTEQAILQAAMELCVYALEELHGMDA